MGIEPTDTRLWTWPLCLFAYPAMKKSRTQESHLTAGLMGTGWALARPQNELRRPDSHRRRAAYETVLELLQSTPQSSIPGKI